jgi:hypothetical protein
MIIYGCKQKELNKKQRRYIMNNKNFIDKEDNTTTKNLATIFVRICVYFISALFIWWGWNVLAPHLNAPLFNYWEVFAMRMALSSIVGIFWQK